MAAPPTPQRARLGRFGPGLLVTAAFIGPGTVTTATAAGAQFGYALLWALTFSILATLVLQEMSARLGLITRSGLGQALRSTFQNHWLRRCMVVLVIAAIAVGNAAYETGNITGSALGLAIITDIPHAAWAAVIGLAAIALLGLGTYRTLERILIALVALMSLAFMANAFLARPQLGQLIRGLFVPRLPSGSLMTVIALIGTTVVPYNLFLHASAVAQKWPADIPAALALRRARIDAAVAIMLGGFITLAIMVTAASWFAPGTLIRTADQLATQLEPLLGRFAKALFALSLFAAGLTSTITAPLAAAYATAGVLGWPQDLRDWRFRAVWVAVILVGSGFAIAGAKPVEAIIFAQAANGLILPVVAVFLLVVVNRRMLLGPYTNGLPANLLGGFVVLVAAVLGAWQIVRALG